MVVIAKGIPRGCQGLFTPVSLGYPLSVFNKNSTHNLQWMDKLIGHTFCAVGSGGHRQHPILSAPASARPAEWELVSPPA